MRDPEIVLFLGAGASKLCGLPTVEHFFERVEDPRGTHFTSACSVVARRIMTDEASGGVSNWPLFDAEKLFAKLEQWANTAGIAEVAPIVESGSANVHVPVAELLAHLKREIVRIYGHAPGLPACRRHYKDLFSMLVQKKTTPGPMWVFTTNYDTVIELLLRDVNFLNQIGPGNVGALDLRTGFLPWTPGPWRREMFSAPPRPAYCPVNLVKLHGSVTWKWDGEGEARRPFDPGLATPTGDYDCLVYFGYKSIPESEPFKTLHCLLKDALLRSAVVVSIGFRFGDPYIRETFDFALRANSALRLVCSLTSQPPSGSPVDELMKAFPDKVSLLLGEDGVPLPFGHHNFCAGLEKKLESARDLMDDPNTGL
jgi:hypothetical protein